MENLKTKRKLSRSVMRLPCAGDLVPGAALFFISRAGVMGAFPLGVAFFAAACDITAAYIYLPILILGVMSAGGAVMKYFLAALTFWLLSELRLRAGERRQNAVRCGALIVICGIFSAVFSKNPLHASLLLLIEGIISGVMYSVFSDMRLFLTKYDSARHVTQAESISLVIFICAVLAGLSEISLPLNISLSQLAGIYLILCAATYLKLPAAACFAFSVGFVCAPAPADSVMLMGIMGVGGIFASLLKQFAKQGIAAGFMIGVTISVLYIAGDYSIPISLISLFFSAAMYLLTPAFVHSKLYKFFSEYFSPGTGENELKLKAYIASELKSISRAFKKLSARAPDAAEPAYSPKALSPSLFESVTERICADCPNSKLCWRDRLGESCRQMFEIIDTMEADGFCNMSNLPSEFLKSCKNPEGFISEFNHVYEIGKRDTLYRTEANQRRSLIAGQYGEISSVIYELSNSVANGFRFMKEKEDYIYRKLLCEKIPVSSVTVIENSAVSPEVYITPTERVGRERLRELVSSAMEIPMRLYDDTDEGIHFIADSLFYAELSIKQRKREGEEVSGDTAAYFQTHDNKLYVILCDGMGSGADAAEESKTTAALLKEFITAGIKPESAIGMINTSLSLKSGCELFSTVDLLQINLLNGEACLFKVGGAQSFILSGKGTETIYSKSLPIGIVDEVGITRFTKKLADGDMAVLVSDGVGEADFGAMRGEWIKRLMYEHQNDTEELGGLILNEALKKTFPKPADDMTVIVAKLHKY